MCKEVRGRKEFSRQEAPSTCSRGWINVYVRIILLAATSRDKNVVACLVISEYLAKGRTKWKLGVKRSRFSIARIDHDTDCTDNRIVQIHIFIKMIKQAQTKRRIVSLVRWYNAPFPSDILHIFPRVTCILHIFPSWDFPKMHKHPQPAYR